MQKREPELQRDWSLKVYEHLFVWLLASHWDMLRGLIIGAGSAGAPPPPISPPGWEGAERQAHGPHHGDHSQWDPRVRAEHSTAASHTCRTRRQHRTQLHARGFVPAPTSTALGSLLLLARAWLQRALSERLRVPRSGCAYTCRRRMYVSSSTQACGSKCIQHRL